MVTICSVTAWSCLVVLIVGRNLSVVARKVGDIVAVFYGDIKAMENRDNAEQSGTLMVWAYQD